MATDFEKAGVLNAHPDPDIPKDMCIVMLDGDVIYAGPIKRSRVTDGAHIYLNPEDFEWLDIFMRKRRH